MEYVVNEKGERTRVVLDIGEYERLLDAAEELEDLAAHDEAVADLRSGAEKAVPWEEVRDRIGSEYGS